MIGIGMGLLGCGRPSWTPADLAPGVLLAWYHGDLADLAAASDGTGAVTGADDTSTIGRWVDRAQGIHAQQATAGSRPIAGYHPLGSGISVHPGAARHLIGASALTGGRYFFAAISPIGANGTRGPGDEPDVFASASQTYASTAGAVDADHSFLIGLEGGRAFWTFGSLSGPCYRDGVETTDAGRWCDRHVYEFHRNANATSGPITLLQSHGGIIPALGPLHEVIVLSALATANDRAKVRAYLHARHLSAPKILCSVDSLLAGYGDDRHAAAPFKLWEHYRRCVGVLNFSIQGQTLQTAITGDVAKLDAHVGTGKNVIVLLGGANEVLADVDEDTIITRIRQYAAMAKTRGRVVVCTIPTGPGYSTPRANVIAAVRTSILAGEVEEADAIVDLYGANAPALQGDGIHFTAAGSATVAAAIAEATDTLLAA